MSNDTVNEKQLKEAQEYVAELIKGTDEKIALINLAVAIGIDFCKLQKGKLPIKEIINFLDVDLREELKPIGEFLLKSYTEGASERCDMFQKLKTKYSLDDAVILRMIELSYEAHGLAAKKGISIAESVNEPKKKKDDVGELLSKVFSHNQNKQAQ